MGMTRDVKYVRVSQDVAQELLNVTSIRNIEMHVNNVDMLNIQTHECR